MIHNEFFKNLSHSKAFPYRYPPPEKNPTKKEDIEVFNDFNIFCINLFAIRLKTSSS